MALFLKRYFAILGAICVLTAVVRAQEAGSFQPLTAGDVTVVETAATPRVAVRLQDDGRLSGRLRLTWPTGKVEPADAEIAFLHDGNLVKSAHTDESGQFHVAALEPGQYTAQTSIEQGSTDFSVEVLEFDESASADEMFMDATLTPLPDSVEGNVLADGEIIGEEVIGECVDGECLVEEEIIEEMGACNECCGFDSGGCCGGGGGGGGCGGGLAGLAGLSWAGWIGWNRW